MQKTSKTTYYRTLPSDSLLGGWKKVKITRKAHNVSRRRTDLTNRFIPLAVLTGSLLGNLYLYQFGSVTIETLAQAQEISTHTTVLSEPDLEQPSEGEAAKITIAGQATTATPSASLSEKQQIINYIVEVFGEDAPAAFNVLFCENASLNPKAVNVNRNGSKDLGVFQLNNQFHGGEENFDFKTNIDKAYKIFESHGKKWTAWTCSHRVGQKNYLGQ